MNRTNGDGTANAGSRRRHHDAHNLHNQTMLMNNQIAMQNIATTSSAPASCNGGGAC